MARREYAAALCAYTLVRYLCLRYVGAEPPQPGNGHQSSMVRWGQGCGALYCSLLCCPLRPFLPLRTLAPSIRTPLLLTQTNCATILCSPDKGVAASKGRQTNSHRPQYAAPKIFFAAPQMPRRKKSLVCGAGSAAPGNKVWQRRRRRAENPEVIAAPEVPRGKTEVARCRRCCAEKRGFR